MSALTSLQTRYDQAVKAALVKAEPLLARYRELLPRERLIVGLGVLLLAATLVYLALWEPFAKARSRQEAALADERALAERLEVIGAAVNKARASGQGQIQGGGQSLLTLVDQAGRAPELGKAPTRLQPEGETEVRVWFEDVSFDNLSRWLNKLQTGSGVTVINADIEKRAAPGVVNARLTLVRG